MKEKERNVALIDKETRSQYLEGKTELTDEDIIKLLDLPADRLVQSKIAAYTDKSYEEIKENYEELLKLSDRLKKEPEYLKYRNTFIAKTKLLYQESAVLYNEIPALIILDKINELAYLLPYQYAKKGNEEKSFADSLKDKNNAFTDFKRVFSGDFSRDYKKGKKQGNQVFISNNLPITKNEAFSELIRITRGIKSNDKTNSVYLYSENDSKLYLFNINKTGFVELQDEFNLKQIRLTPLGKPSVTEDISNSIDTTSINKTIYTTNNFVNDYFTESLLDRGCIQELKRNKQIKNRFSRYMNTLNHLQSLSNDLPEGLLKDSNNYFIKTEKDSLFYKDIIEDKNRNVALEQTYTQGDKSMPGEQKDLYISEEQALRIQLAREIKQNMPNLTDGERAAAIAILEAGAASQKMSLTDYVQQTFPNGVFGDYEKAQNAAHQQGVEINGAVSVSGFGANARAVIYASKTADFSTWCHELSHIWQAQLTGTLKSDAEKAFQVKNGNWQESIYTFADGHTDTSAEAFAYGFEDFLKHKAGEMATEDKKAIFEKFADYMSRTYNGVKQNIEMSEEIAKVYEQFVQLDDNILAEAEKAVQMEKEQEQRIKEIFNSPNLKTSQKVSATIGLVSDEFAALASQYGYDIKGYSHTIDNFFVSHAMKQHGDKEAEEKRGNIAITHSDIHNVFSVYSHPDYIIFGTKTKTGNPAIVYVKNIGNSTIFVEDVRSGKKELAAQTLYKKFGTIDVSSKKEAPELYAHSDPESISIIDVKKEFVNEIENGELIFQAAYHGSGASFERFNTAQYGFSGEGSMSFGWGTYLTSSEDIARDYAIRRTSFTNKIEELQQKYPDSYPYIIPIHNNMSVGMSFEDAKKAYIDYLKENHIKGIRQVIKNINVFTEEDFTSPVQKRNLYSVEIPDGKFLEWDKTVPGTIRTEISEKLHAHIVESDPGSYSGNAAKYLQNELASLFESGMDGQHLYGTLADYLGSEKQASEFLKDSGYTGISYPAGTIYGNGNDATNYVIFNDDDITIKEHLQFQIIGERGAAELDRSEESKIRMENLETAKDMDKAGKDAKTIRLATSWEKGIDGKWRYEINDDYTQFYDPDKFPKRHLTKDLEFNRIDEEIKKTDYDFDKINVQDRQYWESVIDSENEYVRQFIDFENGKQTWKKTADLERIIDAPELFAAYPQLRKVQFKIEKLSEGTRGHAQGNTIILDESATRSTLIHEIQHLIQDIEGFARGGTVAQFEEEIKEPSKVQNALVILHEIPKDELMNYKESEIFKFIKENLSEVLEENIDGYGTLVEIMDRWIKDVKNGVRTIQGIYDEIQDAYETYDKYRHPYKYTNGKTAFEKYKALAGEVEARTVQTRLHMSPLERLNILLSETADVAQEDQIVIIAGMYGKDSDSWFLKQIDEGRLVYIDKKRSLDWAAERGLQLSPTATNPNFNKNLITKDDFVNNLAQNTTKTKGEERTMEKEKIEIQTYKFQNGETIDEILSKQTAWATDEECLDNMIDNSLREVADFADEKENELLKKISIAKNNPEVDLKLLAVQTDAAARYMAAKHYDDRLADIGKRPFSKDFINPYAQDDFPYEFPSWMKNHLEEYPNQNVPEHTSEEEKAYQEWEEMLDDNQKAEEIIEKNQRKEPEEQNEDKIQKMALSKGVLESLTEIGNTIKLDDNQKAEEIIEKDHQREPVSLNPEELKSSLKTALNEVAKPLEVIPFTRENYNLLFPYSRIESPIENVKLGEHQFEKLDVKERQLILKAVHDTIATPDIIINEIRKTVFNDEKEAHVYAKSFKLDGKNKAVQSVIVAIEDDNISISTHLREINNIVNKIKKPEQLIYTSTEIGQMVERITGKQLVTVNPTRVNENIVPPKANISQNEEKSTIKNNNEKSQENHSNAKEYMIQTTRLFLSMLKEKELPFLKGKEQGSIIIIKPQAVRDAATGKAFTGYPQLMAQALIQAVYEQKKIPELEYELITYDQAKACGTFIKKGSPHITLTNYNPATNAASKQMYYFKSGCNSPEMIDLHKESIARNRTIKRIRQTLDEKHLSSEQQIKEKNKITLLHYEELTYLKSLKKDTEQYINSLPAEEKNMLTELCKKTPLTQKTVKELAETLRKDRLISTQLSLQKTSERYFDATECIVPEDFIAKAMAAASLGCSLETTEKTIDSITKDLHQTLSKNIDHYDYGKAFEVGEVINEKCIKNCKDMKNQEYEAAELAKKLEQKQQELKKNPINLLMELLNKNDLSNRTIGGYER